jgi:transposase
VKPLSAEGPEFVQELSPPSPWGELLEAYLDVIDTLTEQKAQLKAVIEEIAGFLKETQLLMTIPGISYYSGLAIYAELGDIGRGNHHKQVVRYGGMNPTIRESGDSRIEGGISKRGSGQVRWILVQAAYTAVNCEDEYPSQFYNRLSGRRHSKKVIVATARKMLVSMYYILDREEV